MIIIPDIAVFFWVFPIFSSIIVSTCITVNEYMLISMFAHTYTHTYLIVMVAVYQSPSTLIRNCCCNYLPVFIYYHKLSINILRFCIFLQVASKMEVFPGSEFRIAYQEAKACGAKVILGDRDVQVIKSFFLNYDLCSQHC